MTSRLFFGLEAAVTNVDETGTGCIWAAAFHYFAAPSCLGRVSKLIEPIIYLTFQFISVRGKRRILNQWIRGMTVC
jgi:hypothetical protein